MSNSDLDRMGQVLLWIFKKSRTLWRRETTPEGEKVSKTLLDDYHELLRVKPPIQQGELEHLVREPKYNRFLLNKPFYLPPLKHNRDFIPILQQVKWKLTDGSDISIRIEMHRFVQTYPGGSRSHPRSLGFRFEKHEASTTHDFMHVQLTRQQCPDWLPTHVPCIPTIAGCPTSLLFCALASLYGKDMYKMLFSGIEMPDKYLKPLKEILRA